MKSPMNRTVLFRSLTGLALLATAAQAQQDFSQVEIKTTHVAGSVYMLEGAGGNIGVSVGDDGVLIVDSQFAPLSPKIEAAIEKLGKGRAKFLLNTHWHGDHTGGNASFGRYADIIAHANVRKRMAAAPNAAKAALPVITFADSLSLHFNGEEIRMVHLQPGHTDGDSVVVFTGSKVLHTGDQFFNGRFPFIDLGSGGDAEGYKRNVETILKLAGTEMKIIPGHGALAGAADAKGFLAMLESTQGKMKRDIAAGKTLDQIKAEGVPDQYKEWGNFFINTSRYLEITYNSLKQ
jgi:cyclase